MKVKQVIFCIGLIVGFALQILAVGFNSTPSRRLESPRLRTDNVSQKSGSSNGGFGKARSNTQAVTTSAAKTRQRKADSSSSDTLLLPEGFDADGASSMKRSSSEGNRKVLSAEGMALKEAIKVEYGDGHGETADEALKEAMKDVLQKVVGVYVDSDFRMNNDQIIKDEIITHSNGFIDHYKKMEESDDLNGRGKTVTIKAWVKMRDFVNRMKKIVPRQCVAMDGVLLDSELTNKLNAEALLRKELGGLNPALDLLEVSLVDGIRPAIRDAAGDSITLRYVFQLRFSKKRYYQEFVPRLSRLLDQIASAKRRDRSLSLEVRKESLHPVRRREEWKECSVAAFIMRLKNYWYGGLLHQKPDRCVSLVANVTKSGTACVREWTLSERLSAVYNECRRGATQRSRSIVCVFRLNDALGELVSCASYRIPEEIAFPCCDQYYDYDGHPDFIPFFPMTGKLRDDRYVYSGRFWYDRYVAFVDISVNREDVPKIKSAEIKLETE